MEDRIDILQYLDEALTFGSDDGPMDDYQQGYVAALEEMFDFFNEG